MEQSFDLVIVGGGLAGLTAALYGARFGLHTCLVEHMAAGGQILNVEKIENYPGFPQGVAGFDLGPMVQEQAENAGAEFVMDTAVGLDVNGDQDYVLRCEGTELAARSVIVAAGSAFRTLGIPGEEAFVGKGVSHCASCDAPFFVGKEVLVVGGGDSALDEAAVLAEANVARVTVVHRGPDFSAQKVAVERIGALGNVETQFNTELVEILGDQTLNTVRLRTNGSVRDQSMAGVFIFVGLEPNTAFLRGTLDLDPSGHVVVDAHLQTSVPGVFAAGDIRTASSRQLVAAAGDGATAAVNVARYLQGR